MRLRPLQLIQHRPAMITMMHCTITRSLSVSAQASARSRIVPAAPIPQRGARPCCSVWVNPHDPQREDQLSAPAEPAFFPGVCVKAA